jgi:hypothetical protein
MISEEFVVRQNLMTVEAYDRERCLPYKYRKEREREREREYRKRPG